MEAIVIHQATRVQIITLIPEVAVPVLLQPSLLFHVAVWKQPRISLVPVGQSHGDDCQSLCSRGCVPYVVLSRGGKPSHLIGRYSSESRSHSR